MSFRSRDHTRHNVHNNKAIRARGRYHREVPYNHGRLHAPSNRPAMENPHSNPWLAGYHLAPPHQYFPRTDAPFRHPGMQLTSSNGIEAARNHNYYTYHHTADQGRTPPASSSQADIQTGSLAGTKHGTSVITTTPQPLNLMVNLASTEEEPSGSNAPLGSEAAMENERALIAKRLKDLDNTDQEKSSQPTPSNTHASGKTRGGPKKSPVNVKNKKSSTETKKVDLQALRNFGAVTIKPIMKNKVDTEQKKKTSFSTGTKRKMPVVNVPAAKKVVRKSKVRTSAHGTSDELKKRILARLSTMGKDELKLMIHNPQLPKSQVIMKDLMACYQETKAVELDKRRFSVAQANFCEDSVQIIPDPQAYTTNPVDLNFPCLTMTDLPPEIVSQLESFLGFNLFESPPDLTSPQFSGSSEVERGNNCKPVITNKQFDSSTQALTPGFVTDQMPPQLEKFVDHASGIQLGEHEITQNKEPEIALSPEQGTKNYQPLDETPFLILRELSQIDTIIQEQLQRRALLYEKLHKYLQQKDLAGRQSPPLLPVTSLSANVTTSSNQASGGNSSKTPDITGNPDQTNSSDVTFRRRSSSNSQEGVNPTSGALRNVDGIAPSNASVSSKAPEVIIVDDSPESKKNQKKPVRKRASPKSSACADCQSLNSKRPPINFVVPEKTGVNDMKVVSPVTVVLGCEDTNSYGYNINSGKITHTFKAHTAGVTAICGVPFNTDGPALDKFVLCSGSADEYLCLFDSDTQLTSRHYLASTVTCLELSLNLLYIGLQCGQILTYDLTTRLLIEGRLIDCGGTSITAIFPTREGPRQVIIVAAKGKNLTMRDAHSGLLLRNFPSATKENVYSLAVYADRLYSGATKHGITFFNLLNGNQEGELDTDVTISCIRLFKYLLFATSYNGNIMIFDLKTQRHIASIIGAGKSLRALQIVNNRVITCSRSKKMMAVCFPSEVVANLKSNCSCSKSTSLSKTG